jgi:hypothetical protein
MRNLYESMPQRVDHGHGAHVKDVLVEDGEIPTKVSDVLKSIDVRKNPWGIGQHARSTGRGLG